MSSPSQRPAWQPPSLAELQALLPAYEFLALIGRGGMGAVFKASQRSLNRLVAIKVLPVKLTEDAETHFAVRFRQEALTMARLAHPGIVAVFESGEAGGLLYIVMEFVDGTDVARMIAGEGRLAPEVAARLLAQVCDALRYAHQHGVVHRDIKPANLLVTRHGQVKIADFGLAKQADATSPGLTKSSVAIGTPDFLAPEAWTPDAVLDGRADVYALGVTLYQMLTGEVPRGLWKMPSVKVGVDPRFDAIIDRAMQPDRDARYPSSSELRQDLERIVGEPRRPAPAPAPSPRGARRRRLILAMAVVPLILGALILLGRRPPAPVARLPAGTDPAGTSARPPATVRDAARWLVQERAKFTVRSQGREFAVESEEDIPGAEFQMVSLNFDRWYKGPPQPPPPEAEFEVLRAVTTLRSAFLRLPGLTDAPFAFLAGNSNLGDLRIEGSRDVTDGLLLHLAGLDRLESLAICQARRWTGRDLARAAWLGRIQEVDFLETAVDDDALRVLAACPGLTAIKVEGTAITRDGLRALAPMRTLTRLNAGNCSRITGHDFVEVLPAFFRLQKLELPNAAFGDEAAAVVATLTNLTDLRLRGTQITDAGLARLSSLGRLQFLEITGTRITDAGLAAFAEARPQCRIER